MYKLPQKNLPRKLIGITATIGVLAAGLTSANPVVAAVGDVTRFPVPIGNSQPDGIALDAAGNLWIGLTALDQIAKATPTGALVTIAIPNGSAIAGTSSLALGTSNRMWLTEKTANRVSYFDTLANTYTGFDIPTANSEPMGIAAGPDGAMWFTQFAGDKIGRVTNAGSITEFTLAADAEPTSIVAGPDGAMWFTAQKGNSIGRITTSGVITNYALPTANSGPTDITVGADANLWFTESTGNRIGRITPKGLIAEFALPTANANANQITLGADANLWFTETGANRIGQITTAGIITEYALPGANNGPSGIVAGLDGNTWYTAKTTNLLGRLLTGVTPVATTGAPTLTAASTKTGSTVTTTAGNWASLPTSYAYQWQRCSANTDASCANIVGATTQGFVISDADAGKFLRSTITAANLNGASSTASQSARLAVDGLPPKLPPTPVVGAQAVQLVPGVTATLKGAKNVKIGKRKLFRVVMSDRAVKGKVRMSIVNSAGIEVYVIAKGKWINKTGKAKKVKKIKRSLAPGNYTLKAVYTPRSNLGTIYPIATMTKPIRIKR